MKHLLCIVGALLALPPLHAYASGEINLAWDDCPPAYGGAGTTNIFNTCASNSGALFLFGSFAPAADMPRVNGHVGIVDFQTDQSVLSDWWRMDPDGPCRAGALVGSYDFTAGPFSCADVWQGHASGVIDVAVHGPNRLRVQTMCALSDGVPIVADGTEYYAFKLTIRKIATVGGCAGCTDPACIVFEQILITQPAGVGDELITLGPAQFATYRGGAIPGGCWTATRTPTWGSIKALYR